MALYRYSVGERVSRGKGQSSLRSAAYLARACYEDQRTGWVHDFTGKKSPIMEASDHIVRAGRHAELASRQEVLFSGLYAPANAPDWCIGAANIERFWNAAEAAERRSDAQIAERIIIVLPHELTLEQAVWALQDHVREFTRQGRVVQVAIHSPEPGHDSRNLHAHVLVSLRGVDENGLKATKAVEQQERFMNRSAYVEHLRENWAHVVNRHLARHGHEVQLDHRSYRRQGLDLEPTLHMGPGDAARERRGERTAVGDHNRAVAERNVERLAQRQEREKAALDKAVEQRHELAAEPVAASPYQAAVAAIVEGWRRAQPEAAPAPAAPVDPLAQDLLSAITAALGTRDPEEMHARLLEGVDRAVFVNTGSEAPQSDLATSLMRVITSALSADNPEPVLIAGTTEAVRRHELRQQREAAPRQPAMAQEAASAPRLITDKDELKQLQRDAYADRDGKGRDLTLKAVILELSPDYKALDDERARLRGEERAAKDERQSWGQARDAAMQAGKAYRERLGWWGRKLTDWRIVRDDNIEGWRRSANEAEARLGEIRTASDARQARLREIEADAKVVLERVTPAAERVLRERQAIGPSARGRLREHYEAEKDAGPFDKLRTARKARLAQWQEKERPMESTTPTMPLSDRYQGERAAAQQASDAAVNAVYDRFAAYDQQARSEHILRVEQEKAAVQSGHARHNAIEILQAIRRGDRVRVLMMRDQEIAAAHREHPVPHWEGWIKDQAERGDREAARALEQLQARERENGIER
ncbi:MAG: MobA/MobL family protein [Alphaproteobacteria bacterium]|nr:MobA/MobL family protein [Alphaproteobacteria bacterium]